MKGDKPSYLDKWQIRRSCRETMIEFSFVVMDGFVDGVTNGFIFCEEGSAHIVEQFLILFHLKMSPVPCNL